MSEQNEQKTLDENVRLLGGGLSSENAKANRKYEGEQIDRALRALLWMAEESNSSEARVDAATAVLRFHLARHGKQWK